MMKTECSVVRDLLPLYAENMVSVETAQYVSEHLKACNECKAELAKLKDGVEFTPVDTSSVTSSDDIGRLKKVMKRMDLRSYYLALVILLYFLVFDLSLIMFWWVISPGDAMGYSLVFQVGVLPVATFVTSLLIGIHNYWGKWKWLSVPILAVMYMLLDYLTFNLANAIAFHKVNTPDMIWFWVGAAISAVGLLIGTLIRWRVQKRKLN